MRSFTAVVSVCTLLVACGADSAIESAGASSSEGQLSSKAAAPWYELYRPGDPVTDQQTVAGAQSSLIGTVVSDADVMDDEFARTVARPALNAGARLFFSFGQCYSGGMIDDLVRLGGNQSILTSARHTETAAYGYGPPSGVDVDFTDAFLRALGRGDVPAERVAAETTAFNPFGPNPAAHRKSERLGAEHAQFAATGDGASLVPGRYAQTGMAVLWAGQPATRDGIQMNAMIARLVEWGFTRDRIWLLYAGGRAAAEHPVVRTHMKANNEASVNLRAATKKQLKELFERTFTNPPAARASTPDFVFFYVGDHGGLNSSAVAKTGFDAPDPLVTPQLDARSALFGAGDE